MLPALPILIILGAVAARHVLVEVDTSSHGHPSGQLVGAGIEDVNDELYGGLYSQMVYGESFEEPPSNGVSGSGFQVPLYGGTTRQTWMAWSPTGVFDVSEDAFNGNQSQMLLNSSVANFGLGQQGMHFRTGKDYEGYLYVKPRGMAEITISLISDGNGIREVLASQTFSIGAQQGWKRLDFSLVPRAGTFCSQVGPERPITPRAGICGYFITPIPEIPDDKTPGPNFRSCYQCSGGLAIEASGAPTLIDLVLLQPGEWGRYKGLPVRRDVGEAMFNVAGWKTLRLGGTMCNAQGYRWKRFRGFPRQPYGGSWHPYASSSFRIFETLELCEAAKASCVITLNNEESPEDLADFVEYCYGDASTTTWGRLRAMDGRSAPYAPFSVEIGNEQALTPVFVAQVRGTTEAMAARAKLLRLPFSLRFAVGQNIDLSNFNATSGALNLTLQMLDALKPFGAHAAWDAHIGGDQFSDSDDFLRVLQASQEVFRQHGSPAQLVVLEENGMTHNLLRALVHARMHIAASYFGGFMVLDTAANGLQVFGQNDNGWDQGQVFMTPDKVWLSPFGWSQSMLSWHATEFNIPLHVNNLTSEHLDVGAYMSTDSAIGVRLVNWGPDPLNSTIVLKWKMHSLPLLETEELVSASLLDVNPPDDPLGVSPRKTARGTVRMAKDNVLVDLLLAPHSFVTLALRPTKTIVI